jgi:enolase
MQKIMSLTAREIWDSRGERTIEVELATSGKLRVKAAVPQGKSRGSFEAHYVSPEAAVRNVKKIIAPKLKRFDVTRQRNIDSFLTKLDGTPTKSRLGANAILGVSIACAKAGAAVENIPLWKYIGRLFGSTAQAAGGAVIVKKEKAAKPRLYINMINGGLHAGNNLRFQEYLVIPKAKNFSEAEEIAADIYQSLKDNLEKNKGKNAVNVGDEGGFAPNFKDALEPFVVIDRVARMVGLRGKIDFGLDAAANDAGINKKELVDLYKSMIKKFGLLYLEDPLPENDFKGFAALRKELPRHVLVAGDDLTVTNLERMEAAHDAGSINALIVKPNQIGTVTESIDAVRKARGWGWKVVVSHRSGETNDDFIADFAVGVRADGFKLGAPARGERIAKYNRLSEIEKGRQ